MKTLIVLLIIFCSCNKSLTQVKPVSEIEWISNNVPKTYSPHTKGMFWWSIDSVVFDGLKVSASDLFWQDDPKPHIVPGFIQFNGNNQRVLEFQHKEWCLTDRYTILTVKMVFHYRGKSFESVSKVQFSENKDQKGFWVNPSTIQIYFK